MQMIRLVLISVVLFRILIYTCPNVVQGNGHNYINHVNVKQSYFHNLGIDMYKTCIRQINNMTYRGGVL